MKIAVFAVNSSFFGRIREELEAFHQVREFDRTDKDLFNLIQTNRLLDWCDVAYFEFAQTPLNIVTHLAAMEKPLIVRAHGTELYGQKQINWRKVSLLILSPIAKDTFLAQKPKFVPEIKELPVGVDPDFFTFSPKRHRKEFGKEIVTVDSFMGRPGKRAYTTIQAFSEIYDQDREWKLWIVGFGTGVTNWVSMREFQATQRLISSLGLESSVLGLNVMPRIAWKNFLMDKDVFWSNSTAETFHLSLAEHMATGGFPVINCWWGSEKLYKDEWIHRNLSSMVKKILDWSSLSPEGKLDEAKKAREWVLQYDEKKVAVEIKELIESVYKR